MLPIKSRFFHLLLFGLYQVVPPSNTHFRSHKEEAHFSKLIVISSFSCITTNFLVLNWSLKNKMSVPVHWFDWNSTNYNLTDNNPERSKTKHEKRKKKKKILTCYQQLPRKSISRLWDELVNAIHKLPVFFDAKICIELNIPKVWPMPLKRWRLESILGQHFLLRKTNWNMLH